MEDKDKAEVKAKMGQHVKTELGGQGLRKMENACPNVERSATGGEMEDRDKAEVKAKMGWHIRIELGESSDVRIVTTLPAFYSDPFAINPQGFTPECYPTILTILPGTTITFLGVLPASWF